MPTRTRAAVGLLLALAAPASCKDAKSDEDLVKEVVRQAIEAANEKKAKGVLLHATEDFRGPRNRNAQECRRILLGFFFQEKWLWVFERKLDVEVKGKTATAALEAILARGKPITEVKDIVPTNATNLLFELELKKTDEGWRFHKAKYHQKPFEL